MFTHVNDVNYIMCTLRVIICVNNLAVLITRMLLNKSERATYILYSLTNMQHAGQQTV